jgi:hypothetical protein
VFLVRSKSCQKQWKTKLQLEWDVTALESAGSTTSRQYQSWKEVIELNALWVCALGKSNGLDDWIKRWKKYDWQESLKYRFHSNWDQLNRHQSNEFQTKSKSVVRLNLTSPILLPFQSSKWHWWGISCYSSFDASIIPKRTILTVNVWPRWNDKASRARRWACLRNGPGTKRMGFLFEFE